MARFDGKRILITGGSAGIGLAGAARIVADGGQVIVTGRDPDRLAAAKRTLGAAAEVIVNDAGAPDAGAALAGIGGPLHGLWLNAGIATLERPEDVTSAAFDRIMATNVRGPMLQMAALSDRLVPGASVLLTGSSAAYEGGEMLGLYAATKGALLSLARSWARALAPRGIRVNTLMPGPIETGFRDFLPPDAKAGFEAFVTAQVPLGRPGTADEAAAVALFLLSDDASYVTGSQYAVDGGYMMH